MPSNTIQRAPISSFFCFEHASRRAGRTLRIGRHRATGRVHEKELASGDRVDPNRNRGIGEDLPRAFFKRHKDAGLLPLARCVSQGLQSEHGFAGPRTAFSRLIRLRGKPPWLSSSNPWMPVAIFGRCEECLFSFHYFFFLVSRCRSALRGLSTIRQQITRRNPYTESTSVIVMTELGSNGAIFGRL